ncbi:MAG: SDR family oxidoreductase [Actinobacteria bacterium]|nr:SDR family oxidoreductase [Actinomycetota bacterium]
MDLGVVGRTALVTASSRGLGRAAARALSEEGANVVLCARGEEGLREAAEAMPGDALAIAADVTDPATPQRLVDAAVERFGALHILVANAGGPPPGRALDPDDAAFEAAFNANMLSSVRLVRSSLPHMRAAGWGRICLMTSVAVKQPLPSLTLSNTARTGLWAWAKTAAQDLFPEGITLNLACPGTHATDRAVSLGLTGPAGDPEDFGRVVAFLCSEPAKFISGTALAVDGGYTLGLL